VSQVSIAFAGTPEFSVATLNAIVATGARVPVVFTQPDRPAGRGRRLTASPVKQAAIEFGLHVEQPAKLDDESMVERLGIAPDLLVVVAYGLLLPDWILRWARLGAVNVHASLLPRWRGAAPIQRAILAGDAETGVSIMQMDAGLDTGPVYATATTEIASTTTAAALHDELASLGARTLARVLPEILAGTRIATPQDSHGACYARKLTKDEALLDWRVPADEIQRKVRAFNPWPVAESRLSDGRRMRIWDAKALDVDSAEVPGSVIRADAQGIVVVAGRGAIQLQRVQAPSARSMEAAAYLSAHPLNGAHFVSAN